MKQRKMLFLFFGLVSLVFSLNSINQTFAKYATKSAAKSEFNVARWDIVVNDQHIKNSEEQLTTITPKYVDNSNVASGVIAPGSVGYFDLTIDGSYTDVSFDYNIEVLANEESSISDLKIMKYYIDSVDNITDATEGNLITSEINYDDDKQNHTIRIYVIWDDATGEMTNEEDSVAGHNAEEQNASVQVKINFKQKI